MSEIKLKVKRDNNIIKYIPIIRKVTGKSIQQIKNEIINEQVILKINSYNTEKLKNILNISNALIKKGATVELYKEDELIEISFLLNLIESYEIIEKQSQEEIDEMEAEENLE